MSEADVRATIPVEGNGHALSAGLDPTKPERDILASDIPGNLGDVASRVPLGLAVEAAANDVEEADRSHEIFKLSRNKDTFEVTVESDITLEDYRRVTRPEDWALFEKEAEQLKGKTVTFLNPTMQGGGVAIMRPAIVHLLRLKGVDARWYVLEGKEIMADTEEEKRNGVPESKNPFKFTKLMHNIFQRRTPKGVRITPEGKALHQEWNERNFQVLKEQDGIKNADIIVYDDPQPAPLKRRIETINPHAKTVFRNHIDTDGELMNDPTTASGEAAGYLLDECGIKDVDAVITHPVEQFVHPRTSEKTFFAPATLEPFDDLNRPLDQAEIDSGVADINAQIAEKNRELIAQGRFEDVQELIGPDDEIILEVARFDESKGMEHAMEFGSLTRQEIREEMRAAGASEEEIEARLKKVRTLIIGNGSKDDPSGPGMYEEMLRVRREDYADEKDSITLMRLKHNYMAINAIMYRAKMLVQTSIAEGCETRISDGVEHGLPAFVFNNGGMPGQVIEGRSGHILDFKKPDHDLQRGAKLAARLFTDDEAYAAMVQSTHEAAHEFNRREYTTTANVTRFARIFNTILSGEPVIGDQIWKISDMVKTKHATQEQLRQQINAITLPTDTKTQV